MAVWCGSCSLFDRKAFQRVMRAAELITGNKLSALQDIFHIRCLGKAHKITTDCNHLAHRLFARLPSGKRYRSIQSRISRLKNSFYLQAIRILNKL
ncbi:hypothetical protein PGIGA_G00085540 [Pangasianodon gigas]|uniref:Uncharacterized protein n=1 Tax=Pangasianodon gigas TaxID=30993 RepID=A0ACC5XAY4_PANGG|nr:hypothetical protein [Pangasianodon gigas]